MFAMKLRYLSAIAVLSLAVSACGDDGTGTANNNPLNNLQLGDSGVADMGSTPEDMGSTPEDMGSTPEDMGTDPADMGDSDAGADMANEQDMAMEQDMGAPYEWPATAGDFISTADRVSYIATFGVPAVNNGVPECCRDFGAISENPGQLDNAFAALDAQLSGIPGAGVDFQAALNDAITGGSLVFLLDHRELDGADDPDGFLLSWLEGGFGINTTYAEAGSGTGVFDVRASSFIGTTGEPQQVMNRADMTASLMSGGPISINVVLPFGSVGIGVPIDSMNAEATATITVDSVTYIDGELSGYIPEDKVFEGVNTLASSPECACLGLNGADLFTKSGNGQWSGACDRNAATKCSQSSEFACQVVAGSSILDGQICSVFPGIIQNAADIDSDGDSNDDALSIGLTWTAVDATLQ
jgi:hypothetical protein